MNIISEAKSLDLASLQGQVAGVVSSLNGVDIQRLCEDDLFDTNTYHPYNPTLDEDKKQNYINMLKDLDKNQSSFDEEGGIRYNDTIATYYISRNIFYSMMTLGKYINEVQYDSFSLGFVYPEDSENSSLFKYGVDKKLGGITPYKDDVNMDIYNLMKKGLSYAEKCDASNNVLILKHLPENNMKFENIYDLFDDCKLCKNITPSSQAVCAGCCDCLPGTRGNTDAENTSTDSLYTVFADALSVTSPEFTDNMKTLVTDMYKEYYMTEIKHLQTALNSSSDANIISELNLLTPEIHNEFVKYVVNVDNSDISNYLPLHKLTESIKDIFYDTEDNANSYTLFVEDSTYFTAKEVLSEEIGMINSVGNAIHYDLEIINRLKAIDDKIKNESICTESVRQLKCDLNRCFGLIEHSLLEHNIYRFGSKKDADNSYVFTTQLTDSLRMELNEIKNNVENYETVLKNIDYDITNLNDEALSELGITDFLKTRIYDTMKVETMTAHSVNGDEGKKYTDLTTYVADQTVNNTNKTDRLFNRHQSIRHYRNFALIHHKLTTSLSMLAIMRYLQCYGYLNETEYKCRSLKNKREYKIQAILDSPVPKGNYSFNDMATVAQHVFNLKHKMQRKKRVISTIIGKAGFDNNDNFEDVMEMLVAIANAYSSSTGEISIDYSTIMSDLNSQTKKRFYPLVKSLIYLYPQYFNGSKSTVSNLNGKKVYNNNKYEFDVLTNHLNYIAQSIVANSNYNNNGTLIEGNKQYTFKDFERLLSLIVYYCNSITTHWSDKDEITSKYIENASESSMYGIYGNLINLEDSIFKMGSKKVNVDVDGTELAFQMNLPEFILEHMTSIMTSSNLTKTTKFVSFVTIYVIAAYFSHLYHTNALKPLINTKN